MRRKKRVICEDFPKGELDYEAVKRAFRELRQERLARERKACAPGAAGAIPASRRTRKRAAPATIGETLV